MKNPPPEWARCTNCRYFNIEPDEYGERVGIGWCFCFGTEVKTLADGREVRRIFAARDFGSIKKWDRGGFIEDTHNLIRFNLMGKTLKNTENSR